MPYGDDTVLAELPERTRVIRRIAEVERLLGKDCSISYLEMVGSFISNVD